MPQWQIVNLNRGNKSGTTPSINLIELSFCCCSVTQSFSTVCDPMNCSTPGFPVLHYLLELAQTQCPSSWWCHSCHSWVAQTVNNSSASAGDIRETGLIPGSGRSSGGGYGNPLQYSCLENPMDRGACGLQSIAFVRVGHDWIGLARIQTWVRCS